MAETSMKKQLAVFCAVIFLLQIATVGALTSSEAKQDWLTAKQASSSAHDAYREAKVKYAADKTEENKQARIDAGKDLLSAALDEAEAWLIWKDTEVQEDTRISQELKNQIRADVEKNLATVDTLRAEVDAVETEFDLGVVFLRMIIKYVGLVTDVARNWGKILVEIGTGYIEKAESYEATLRQEAEKMADNGDIIAKLDKAKSELQEARENVANAKEAYEDVVLPGTPLIKFSEGNNYLRVARANLLSAHSYLDQAYKLMLSADAGTGGG